jgi:hypothetical protein
MPAAPAAASCKACAGHKGSVSDALRDAFYTRRMPAQNQPSAKEERTVTPIAITLQRLKGMLALSDVLEK